MPTISSIASSEWWARFALLTPGFFYAATTRGLGSTASDARHGWLSIVTSAKPTALSWSHISTRASCVIDSSGTTTARACDVSNSAGRSCREASAPGLGRCGREFESSFQTQLVAKGHNFPFLTLVGVLRRRYRLTSGDPRAAERTFQLLQQVTGRAGRGQKPAAPSCRPGSRTPGHRGPDLRRRRAVLPGGDARPRARRPAALRTARRPRRVGERARGRRGACPRHGAGRRSAARRRRPRPRRGAARADPRPLPLPAPRQDRARGRPPGLSAGLARPLPKVRGNVKVSVDVDPQSFL